MDPHEWSADNLWSPVRSGPPPRTVGHSVPREGMPLLAASPVGRMVYTDPALASLGTTPMHGHASEGGGRAVSFGDIGPTPARGGATPSSATKPSPIAGYSPTAEDVGADYINGSVTIEELLKSFKEVEAMLQMRSDELLLPQPRDGAADASGDGGCAAVEGVASPPLPATAGEEEAAHATNATNLHADTAEGPKERRRKMRRREYRPATQPYPTLPPIATAEEKLGADLLLMEHVRHKRCVWDAVANVLLCPHNHPMSPIVDVFRPYERRVSCDGCTRHIITDEGLLVTAEHVRTRLAAERAGASANARGASDRKSGKGRKKGAADPVITATTILSMAPIATIPLMTTAATMLETDAYEYEVTTRFGLDGYIGMVIKEGGDVRAAGDDDGDKAPSTSVAVPLWWRCHHCHTDLCAPCYHHTQRTPTLQVPHACCSVCSTVMRTCDAAHHTCGADAEETPQALEAEGAKEEEAPNEVQVGPISQPPTADHLFFYHHSPRSSAPLEVFLDGSGDVAEEVGHTDGHSEATAALEEAEWLLATMPAATAADVTLSFGDGAHFVTDMRGPSDSASSTTIAARGWGNPYGAYERHAHASTQDPLADLQPFLPPSEHANEPYVAPISPDAATTGISPPVAQRRVATKRPAMVMLEDDDDDVRAVGTDGAKVDTHPTAPSVSPAAEATRPTKASKATKTAKPAAVPASKGSSNSPPPPVTFGYTHQVTIYDPPHEVSEHLLLSSVLKDAARRHGQPDAPNTDVFGSSVSPTTPISPVAPSGPPAVYRCFRRMVSCATIVVQATSKAAADDALKALKKARFGRGQQQYPMRLSGVTKAS